jgi:type III pantothenate kinase
VNLVVDIGNTAIKATAFRKGQVDWHRHVLPEELEGLLRTWYGPILVSSVRQSLPEFIQDLSNVHVFSQDSRLPFSITPQLRTQTGTDRLANAAALCTLFPQQTAMAVDMGTCITYSLVHHGKFVGGGITPGYRTRLRAMHTFTGKLPFPEPVSGAVFPGKNTVQAMLSATWIGVKAEVEAMIGQAMQDTGGPVHVILTGGDSGFFADAMKNIIFADALLTPKGLNAILELNASN